MTEDWVKPEDFIAYVNSRSYVAVPLTNSQAAAEGAEPRIGGYELRGPRGNRHVTLKNRDGLLPLGEARLWCDGVDYATGVHLYRKARKNERRVE